ncbi:MAG TPA: ATP-binding cassette domain-containing protein [Polyangia bacterium]|nr:ATP-binding cassette domain-containing protein [Polyangia bacterium]
MPAAIEVHELSFSYPHAPEPVLHSLSFALPAGARCLLLGANGAGKSTLLRLIAGRHMLSHDVVRVLGRPAFHDASLSADVAFLGGPFPFSADISVRDILAARPGVDPKRRTQVLAMLDVDPGWRMHQVSDGQRRRVQLLLDLERTLRVILLDEVTAELDVLARADLLRFLREESRDRGVAIVYASHVLDGLEDFATDVAFLSRGRLRCFAPIGEVLAKAPPGPTGSVLHRLCEAWMREDRENPR